MDEEDPIVEFMVANDLADRLLAEHVADHLGHCRTCTLGGQRGHQCWPCSIYGNAVRAREVQRRRDGPGGRST